MRSRRCRPAISFLRATRGPVSQSPGPGCSSVCVSSVRLLLACSVSRHRELSVQQLKLSFSVSQLASGSWLLQRCRRCLRVFRRSHSATSPRSLLRDHDVEAVSVPIRSCKHCQARFIPCGLTCSTTSSERKSTTFSERKSTTTYSAPARLAPLFIVGGS